MPWKDTEKMDQKIEFAMKALSAASFTELCREYGISRKTGYKWRERFVADGIAGMEEETRKPHGHAAELGEEVVCRIVRLKEAHRHWGARKIRELYRRKHKGDLPSESSFKRVLERAGMTEKRRRQRREQSGRLEAQVEILAPNDLWTVDFKGWWRGGERKRIEPLTVRDAKSRYILEMHMVENAKTETVGARFERLFEAHGLPGAIRSDNGTPFACAHSLLGLTRLSAWWLALGIDLVRGRPGCPQDNGAHERMHLDMYRELEKGKATSEQAAFDVWREEFNTERPHEAIDMRTPAEVYHPSTRAFEGTPEAIDYGAMETRKVTCQGTIGYGGEQIKISTALRDWNVGLNSGGNGLEEVWFAKLLIGQIDSKTASFRPTTPLKKALSRTGAASFWPSALRSEGQNDAPLTTAPKPKKL